MYNTTNSNVIYVRMMCAVFICLIFFQFFSGAFPWLFDTSAAKISPTAHHSIHFTIYKQDRSNQYKAKGGGTAEKIMKSNNLKKRGKTICFLWETIALEDWQTNRMQNNSQNNIVQIMWNLINFFIIHELSSSWHKTNERANQRRHMVLFSKCSKRLQSALRRPVSWHVLILKHYYYIIMLRSCKFN